MKKLVEVGWSWCHLNPPVFVECCHLLGWRGVVLLVVGVLGQTLEVQVDGFVPLWHLVVG